MIIYEVNSVLLQEITEGSLAEWLEAITCNPEALGSSFPSDH